MDAPGRPLLYGTTEKFLRVFGLSSLADLPETEALDVASAAQGQNTAMVAEEGDKDQITIDSMDESSSEASDTLTPEGDETI